MLGTGQDTRARVSFSVKNTGTRDGDEVVQLYVDDKVSSVVGPIKQLKKFRRVPLKAGEQKTIDFDLAAEDLKLLNPDMHWVAEAGIFAVMVGPSSDVVRLTKEFELSNSIYLNATK